MARGRFISKEISLDLKVASLSDDTARLLFTWLIAHLDCEGRMYGEPHLVKAEVFPRSRVSVARIEKYLKEMEVLSLIIRYPDEKFQKSLNFSPQFSKNLPKVQFLSVPNFEKHQTGLRKDKESPSSIPAPPADFKPPEIPTNDGLGSGKDKVKVSISKGKDKVSIREGFVGVIGEIRGEFPDLEKDFVGLFDDCVNWWERSGRELKDPKKALRNWLRKERANRASPGGNNSRKLGEIPSDAELDKEEASHAER